MGAAGVLGLVFVLGLFGFLSLLGTNPSKPLNSLGSEEEVVAREQSDEHLRSATASQSEGEPGPAAAEESPAASDPPGEAPAPTPTPGAAALAAVAAPGEPRAAAPQRQPPATAPAAVPTIAATPHPTLEATPEPTAPPPTPTPQPDACSIGGTPAIRQNGHHVRIEYATVLSMGGDVLLVDAGGTVALLRLTASTAVTGNLGAATVVRAEGHREGDGSVTAEVIEVLCPDSARG